MAEASLKLGTDWATKEDSLLGYNDENGNYKPIPFDFSRASIGTRVNRDGLIEVVQDNIPRIDFSDGEGSLKLEPQRTNLIDYSEDLSVWAATRCVIVDNDTTSPDGTINASKMTSNNAAESYIQINATLSGSIVAYSFYAKKGDLDYVHSLLWDVSANGCRQWFNISNGTIGSSTTFGSGYSVDSASIENMGNGWYRCTTIVNCSSGTNGFRVNISSADSNINSPVNSYGYFWGIQAEDSSSYPTSYIQTSGSAVTRVADVCNNAQTTFNDSEGVLYAEVAALYDDGTNRRISISDGGYANRVILGFSSATNTLNCFVISGSAVQYNPSEILSDITLNNKIALKYKLNDFALWINGVEVDTDSSGIAPSGLNTLQFTDGDGSATPFYGKTKQILYFPTALSDTELQELTTI